MSAAGWLKDSSQDIVSRQVVEMCAKLTTDRDETNTNEVMHAGRDPKESLVPVANIPQ